MKQERGYLHEPDYPGSQRESGQHSMKDKTSNSSSEHGKSFQRVCKRFSEKTSMQGVPYIGTSKKLIAKFIWIILLLAAMGAMLFHLYFLFDQFFGWPKQTKIVLGYSNLNFPAITICNVNTIRSSKLHLAKRPLQNLVDQLDPDNLIQGKRKKRFADNLDRINFTIYDEYDYYVDDYEDELEDEWIAPPEKSQQAEDAFVRMYMQESRDTRSRMGHQIRDMLVSCSFEGKTCYPENFTTFQTPEYGNCFTLDSRRLVSKAPGPRKGLIMVLYTENHEYIDGVTTGFGARLAIHDRNTVPFPADDGLFVSANSETHVGLRMVQVTRLGQPWGSCESGAEFRSSYNLTYSRQACSVLCEQKKAIKDCGCFQQVSDEINRLLDRGDAEPCRTKENVVCLQKVLNSKGCACLNPCSEEDYPQAISSRQWPTEKYATLLKHTICQKKPAKCANISEYVDSWQLSSNFLKLAIYYEDLNNEIITEEEEISTSQFLSDVGGALGLWIGLSVLSIFEVFQFGAEIIAYLVWKCGNNENQSDRRSGRNRNHELSLRDMEYKRSTRHHDNSYDNRSYK
ncbi:hypothetical protein ScPMuIL_005782 [Solemya velum]